jgi:hypothetical protein
MGSAFLKREPEKTGCAGPAVCCRKNITRGISIDSGADGFSADGQKDDEERYEGGYLKT